MIEVVEEANIETMALQLAVKLFQLEKEKDNELMFIEEEAYRRAMQLFDEENARKAEDEYVEREAKRLALQIFEADNHDLHVIPTLNPAINNEHYEWSMVSELQQTKSQYASSMDLNINLSPVGLSTVNNSCSLSSARKSVSFNDNIEVQVYQNSNHDRLVPTVIEKVQFVPLTNSNEEGKELNTPYLLHSEFGVLDNSNNSSSNAKFILDDQVMSNGTDDSFSSENLRRQDLNYSTPPFSPEKMQSKGIPVLNWQHGFHADEIPPSFNDNIPHREILSDIDSDSESTESSTDVYHSLVYGENELKMSSTTPTSSPPINREYVNDFSRNDLNKYISTNYEFTNGVTPVEMRSQHLLEKVHDELKPQKGSNYFSFFLFYFCIDKIVCLLCERYHARFES